MSEEESPKQREIGRKILDYITDLSLGLLENVDAIQRGVCYDYKQGAYVDRDGHPVRDMFGQLI